MWPYSEFHTWLPFQNTNLFLYQVYYRGRSEKDIHVQNRMRSGGSGGAGLDTHDAGGRLETKGWRGAIKCTLSQGHLKKAMQC